jgi:hypothetical protein
MRHTDHTDQPPDLFNAPTYNYTRIHTAPSLDTIGNSAVPASLHRGSPPQAGRTLPTYAGVASPGAANAAGMGRDTSMSSVSSASNQSSISLNGSRGRGGRGRGGRPSSSAPGPGLGASSGLTVGGVPLPTGVTPLPVNVGMMRHVGGVYGSRTEDRDAYDSDSMSGASSSMSSRTYDERPSRQPVPYMGPASVGKVPHSDRTLRPSDNGNSLSILPQATSITHTPMRPARNVNVNVADATSEPLSHASIMTPRPELAALPSNAAMSASPGPLRGGRGRGSLLDNTAKGDRAGGHGGSALVPPPPPPARSAPVTAAGNHTTFNRASEGMGMQDSGAGRARSGVQPPSGLELKDQQSTNTPSSSGVMPRPGVVAPPPGRPKRPQSNLSTASR